MAISGAGDAGGRGPPPAAGDGEAGGAGEGGAASGGKLVGAPSGDGDGFGLAATPPFAPPLPLPPRAEAEL